MTFKVTGHQFKETCLRTLFLSPGAAGMLGKTSRPMSRLQKIFSSKIRRRLGDKSEVDSAPGDNGTI